MKIWVYMYLCQIKNSIFRDRKHLNTLKHRDKMYLYVSSIFYDLDYFRAQKETDGSADGKRQFREVGQ